MDWDEDDFSGKLTYRSLTNYYLQQIKLLITSWATHALQVVKLIVSILSGI